MLSLQSLNEKSMKILNTEKEMSNLKIKGFETLKVGILELFSEFKEKLIEYRGKKFSEIQKNF